MSLKFFSSGILALCLLGASSLFGGALHQPLGEWFAQGQDAQIEQALGDELAKDPAEPQLWLELASLRKSQADYNGAVAAYQKAFFYGADWKAQKAIALCLEQEGKFAAAESILRGLIQAHPDDPDLLWGLGRLAFFQSQWKKIRTQPSAREALLESRKYFLKLTSVKNDFALGFWELAEVCRQLGDWDQALRAYSETLRRDGSYKLAHRHMAEILERLGRYQEALAKYDQAIAVEPGDLGLKKEARLLAKKVPGDERKRKDERLQQWRQWQAPSLRPIAASPITLRVGLFTGQGRMVFRSDSGLQVETPAGTPLTQLAAQKEYHVLYRSAGGSKKGKESWTIKDSEEKTLVSFSQRIWIAPLDPEKPIAVHAVPSNTGYFFAKEEDRAYRGLIEISPHPNAGFTVINRVTLEAYTAGVVSAEMSAAWPMEALRSQAILVRTYALSKLGRHNSEGFDVCDSVHCQVYRGLRAETERTNQAVNDTAGLVLKHNGKIMPVAFSAQCGGHTQDYEEAWGVKAPVPGVADYDAKFDPDMEFPPTPRELEEWIKGNPQAYCRVYELKAYRNFRWSWRISADEIEAEAGVGRIRRLVVTHRSTAGWADRLWVEGETGNKEIKGDRIRSFLGGVRSNLIWIEPQFNLKGWPEEFIIYGGGWGHGVGMCQVGAYGLAKMRKSYLEILKHYFPLGDVERLAAN